MTTEGGTALPYDYLVVATGLVAGSRRDSRGLFAWTCRTEGIARFYAGPRGDAATWGFRASRFVEERRAGIFGPPRDRDEMRRRAASNIPS